MRVKVLLLDIEGTATPIDFVYDTLFPYARKHMTAYLAENFEAEDRALLLEEYAGETSGAKPVWQEPPVAYLLWLMDQDRKSRGLKSIQGKIWERGFKDGSLRGEVYSDVAPALKRWKDEGGRTYIYSSGSAKAQQLLFRYTTEGDLTLLVDGYFDTEVGAKREVTSYRNIAARIGVEPGEFLFVSDVAAELEAAQSAGYRVLLSVRPGNAPQEGDFPTIKSFDQIFEQVEVKSERR